MDEQIYVTLQMGVETENLTLDRNAQADLFNCIREKSHSFVERHCPNQKIATDRILLFRHNYESQNMLQLLQNSQGSSTLF